MTVGDFMQFSTQNIPDGMYFDGDCWFCKNYVRLVELRIRFPLLQLHDLRERLELVKKVRDLGLEPNEGMLVVASGEVYHGVDAVMFFQRNCPASGLTGALEKIFFRYRIIAVPSYSAAKLLRRAYLALARKRLL